MLTIKIKELNTYIGITPKVTLPNYYWDNYGNWYISSINICTKFNI